MDIIKYDVFTSTVNKGNPVGIIPHGDEYDDEMKQKIAYIVGYNECCFICKSDVADYKLRYFTPGYETPLCGHATIGTMKYIIDCLCLNNDIDLKIETGAGILDIHYNYDADEILMEQANATFTPFEGNKERLLNAIGLSVEDLDTRYPIVYGSTGSWTTLIPIKTLDSFNRMKPNNSIFPSILKEMPRASIHPFTLECYDQKSDMHGRHFSSCYSGTIEDSVTGTASGVMSAYYLKYIKCSNEVDIMIEQGNEINKEGYVHGYACSDNNEIRVKISGTAVKSKVFKIDLTETV